MLSPLMKPYWIRISVQLLVKKPYAWRLYPLCAPTCVILICSGATTTDVVVGTNPSMTRIDIEFNRRVDGWRGYHSKISYLPGWWNWRKRFRWSVPMRPLRTMWRCWHPSPAMKLTARVKRVYNEHQKRIQQKHLQFPFLSVV